MIFHGSEDSVPGSKGSKVLASLWGVLPKELDTHAPQVCLKHHV